MTIEHEAFQKLTDALWRAQSAAFEIAVLRPDQQNDWEQITDLIRQVNDKAMDLR